MYGMRSIVSERRIRVWAGRNPGAWRIVDRHTGMLQ